MKFLKYFLLAALLHGYPSCSMGQTIDKTIEANYALGLHTETNLIKNPSAGKNRRYSTAVGITPTRDTSAGNKIDNKASWSIDATAINDYQEFELISTPDDLTSGNCGFSGIFKGDGRLYRAQILDGSSVVLAQTVPFTNETGFREFRVWYPCGASGARKVRITQTEAGTAPGINVGRLFYGRMEPGAGVPPNSFIATTGSGGAILSEGPLDWINGSCALTDTSLYTCTFTSGFFTSTPSCSVTPLSVTGNTIAAIETVSATSVAVRTNNSTTGAKTASQVSLSCTKTGADFIQSAITPNTPSAPTIQKFLSGSGTYITPPGVKYIRVRMVGGGGGGAGSGTTSGTAATAGGNTTFGTSLLVANGGAGGVRNTIGGVGGTASLGTGPVGTALSGGQGQGGSEIGVTNAVTSSGGQGGTSCFGGSGGGGNSGGGGGSASANTGSGGGGGAHANGTVAGVSGSGGGSGGCIDAIISNPGTSYPYAVGAAGGAGGAGTNGAAGGAGALGYIEVTEYYGEMNVPVLLGSVTSNFNGALRLEYLTLTSDCTSTPCTISANSGAFTSVTRSTTGTYAVNYPAGTWSTNPACTWSANTQESLFGSFPTSTSVGIVLRNSSGTNADGAFTLYCIGPR